jgi:diguanylate cyclase
MRWNGRDAGDDPVGLLPGWWWRGGDALGYGRLLGLGSLLTTGLALAVLRPTPVHWPLLAAVVAVHLCVAWLSHALPRRTSSEWALLVFPVLAMLGLALTTVAAPGLAGVMVGYFVLCFAYTGLFLPDRGGVVLLLPALATYLVSLRAFNAELALRTCFVAGVWLALAQLLNRMRRRQDVLVAQLQADAHIDPLTGLANRRGMARFLAEAEAGDVLVVFDLDHFKRVNDERGHAYGDHVLETFGRHLGRQLRTRDRAARSGGEEMVVLLRCREQERCGKQLTRRLREAFGDEGLGVTFSAGLAVVGDDRTVEETLGDADRALYRAKRAGRDQVWLAGDPRTGEGDTPVWRHGLPAGSPVLAA